MVKPNYLGLAALCLLASDASAQLYVGQAFSAGMTGADYSKTVIVRSGAPVHRPPPPGETRERTSASSASRSPIYGAGVTVGYRHRFLDDVLFATVETQAALYRGHTEGSLPGTGTQRGEAWPEDWRLGRAHDLGLTVRLGAPLGDTRASFYALGGARSTRLDFEADYIGCEYPLCASDGSHPGFSSGTTERKSTVPALTVGGGMEWTFSESGGLRGELSYTRYGDDRATTLFDDNTISVPALISSDEVGLTVGLLWYL